MHEASSYTCRALLTHVDKGIHVAELDHQLAKLPVAEGASFDSYRLQHEATCLPGTRAELLDQIQAWSNNSAKHIWWLSGGAGAGKSTIARTVAASFAREKCLAGSFFFSRGGGDLGNAGKFVTTLARSLARHSPSFASSMSNALSGDEDLPRQGLRMQWKALIEDSLHAGLDNSAGRAKLVFVLDALDECDQDQDVKLILQLFLELNRVSSANIQVFVTSRPETPIRHGFASMPQVAYLNLQLGDIPAHIVEHDIKIYLECELRRIGTERQLQDWPIETQISALVENCNALFIYAATVCRFVSDQDDDPKDRLSIILQNDAKQSGLEELDKMYIQVLEHSVIRNRSGIALERIISQFQSIIGCFVVLFDVLSTTELSLLLEVSLNKVQAAFSPLHSLIYVTDHHEEPLRLLHPSFRDFLLDNRRCINVNFHINAEDTHSVIARNCIRVLLTSLRRDMCNLSAVDTLLEDIPLSKVNECISKNLQYACLYWVDHLSQVSPQKRQEIGFGDNGPIHRFLQQSLLYWVEAMTLMGRMHECVLMVIHLESLVQVRQGYS